MRTEGFGLILFLLGSCHNNNSTIKKKPYTIAMTYVADCPLSVRSSSEWTKLVNELPIDSFETLLFLGDCDIPEPKTMLQSAEQIVRNLDSARSLGFTHYPMVQIWAGQTRPENLMYSGPLDNSALETGRPRFKADTFYVRSFLNRLRRGESPTFEKHPVHGCYIEP